MVRGADENVLKEASENWKLEVIKNLESRTSMQRYWARIGHSSMELSMDAFNGCFHFCLIGLIPWADATNDRL